jgi:hypothetical protein
MTETFSVILHPTISLLLCVTFSILCCVSHPLLGLPVVFWHFLFLCRHSTLLSMHNTWLPELHSSCSRVYFYFQMSSQFQILPPFICFFIFCKQFITTLCNLCTNCVWTKSHATHSWHTWKCSLQRCVFALFSSCLMQPNEEFLCHGVV